MIKLYHFLISIFLFMVFGCGGNSSTTGEAAPMTPAAVTVTIRYNQTISGFPHKIDQYIPSNATTAIVFLHGGGGKKEGFAYNLGLKTTDDASSYLLTADGEAWLKTNKVAVIFPQGQNRAALSWTWTNYVMDSGENDVSFLQNLKTHLASDPSFANVTKYYLAGHSNGGMMTNRMWCESPATFNAYGALAGPPSSDLAASGAHPCNPSSVKPYMAIVGNADQQLQTSGQMSATTWSLYNYNSSSSAWVTGTVLNEKVYYSNRVALKCSSSVNAPLTSGQLTTYSDCSQSLKLVVVSQTTVSGSPSGGDHCLLSVNANCTTTLAGATGLDYKSALFDFFKLF
jgi:poly(3-hydroxybutyrate) depolymerase